MSCVALGSASLLVKRMSEDLRTWCTLLLVWDCDPLGTVGTLHKALVSHGLQVATSATCYSCDYYECTCSPPEPGELTVRREDQAAHNALPQVLLQVVYETSLEMVMCT